MAFTLGSHIIPVPLGVAFPALVLIEHILSIADRAVRVLPSHRPRMASC
jgi:hypothetical protein